MFLSGMQISVFSSLEENQDPRGIELRLVECIILTPSSQQQ